MKQCPICGQRILPGMERCPACGWRIQSPHPAAPEPAPRAPGKAPTPPASCFCCGAILIPVVFLLVLVIAVSFQTVHQVVVAPQPEPAMSVPVEEYVTLPAASERFFSITGGELTFLPDKWDGGTILRVPRTVDGQTVTSIGPGCFRDCDGLTTIELPDTITSIADEAFSGCARLRGLFIPEGTVSIGRDAFALCGDLESVYIPSSVESIAPGCFDDCAGLLYIFYEGPYADWTSLYSDYINPFTAALCLDGTHPHGTSG